MMLRQLDMMPILRDAQEYVTAGLTNKAKEIKTIEENVGRHFYQN